MRGIILAGLLLAAQISNAQAGNAAPAIEWSATRVLKITDFKVVRAGQYIPKQLGVNQAVTRTGFLYTLTHINSGKEKGRNFIKIQALMYPGNSYIKAPVLNAGVSAVAYLLNHEQKHFDISEIFAREASRFLQTHHFSRNYASEITNEMQRLSKEAAALQKLYDKETNNGRNEPKQREWNRAIAKRLSRLSAYSQKDFFLDIR
ncbi:hypothetical protein A8C56_05185 [Niabella ginsenosidivorans]|uniref:DUF922 domain-containing protein n=1 Tax=Niabella ginsenosidivorans TaxID=1176587 RepID=A0A1A9HZF5_9BACT|nr:hypothetical protein [Niabella ginsenosidivorans]ANH80465.1 hypothetical protein A8C56_05185 [Niabella ginsenosidivorans]